jgi:hypothetical protein
MYGLNNNWTKEVQPSGRFTWIDRDSDQCNLWSGKLLAATTDRQQQLRQQQQQQTRQSTNTTHTRMDNNKHSTREERIMCG